MSRDGGCYRMWIIKTLVIMLVGFSVFLGGCGQQGQPKENQPAQGNAAGQQQPQEEGGRPDSKIARLGRGTYTLDELPPPEPVSADYGSRNVEVHGNGDLAAHPPSGATFTIMNKRRPVSVAFTPSFISDVPVEKTDGVTFEVWSGEERLYQKHVLPDDPTSGVTLDLPEARTKEVLQLSFVTRVGPSGDRGWDWALWRDVRIVVGKEE
jgi:predicted small lipoprotein YifL